MGKRRNTAKTGDKGIYNSREVASSVNKSKSDDKEEHDNDYLQLDSDAQDDASSQGSDHQEIDVKQHVMDLGIGGDSDSSDDDSSDDEGPEGQDIPDDDSSGSSSSSDDDDDELEQPADPRHWGKKKSSYYHGDTGDIEIGQDEEDAFDEEEAAKEVESSRYKDMDEGDFMLPDDDEDDDSVQDEEESVDGKDQKRRKSQKDDVATIRNISKLSTRDKRKFIKKQHPELIPLATFFSDVCKELRDTTAVATEILMENEETVESVGATTEGQQYLLTKAMLGNSTALNAAIYLLLKSEMEEKEKDSNSSNTENSIQTHPVMAQLQKCNSSEEKLKEAVTDQIENVSDQIAYLVKAAALMTGLEQEMSNEDPNEQDDDFFNSNAEEDEKESASSHGSDSNDEDVASTLSESRKDLKAKEVVVLNEARFGLRPSEVNSSKKGKKRSKRKSTSDTYFGDLDQNDAQSKTKLLASTINSIEQRSASKKKRKNAALVEQIDETEADSDLAQGLKMMEEELGKLERGGDEGGVMNNDNIDESASMEGSDGDDGAVDFYNAVANRMKEKKMIKKKRYEVAPKYPGTEAEITGERAISRAIMSNRGLVAHKAKINRNPRVKKREQYRKALIRRKGAVREVRTNEGHKYGGEGTGIKSGISRSRKL